MRCATMIVVCAKAMTTSRKCPTFSSAAASALIGYHTPRQFSFFSFLSFLLSLSFPTIIATEMKNCIGISCAFGEREMLLGTRLHHYIRDQLR